VGLCGTEEDDDRSDRGSASRQNNSTAQARKPMQEPSAPSSYTQVNINISQAPINDIRVRQAMT
jgi:hypothetical protein